MKIKQKKGSILAFAVILMSFMLLIALGLAFASLRGRKSVDVSSNSTTAFQKTDEGMELFLFELYENSKPFDSLSDLAKSIKTSSNGKSYECKEISNGGQKSAVITGDDFEMISYKEVNPDKNDGNKFQVIENCNTEIARVSKVKVSGNFNSATRSIEIALNNSLERGRIARWDFEDNVQSIREWGCGEAGAPEVKDSSKDSDYILTLCPIEDGSDKEKSPNNLPGTGETKNCPLLSAVDGNGMKVGTEIKGFYMNHLPKWKDKPESDKKCYWTKNGVKYQISCGSFVSGIYYDGSNGKGDGTGKNSPIDYNTKPGSGDYEEDCRTGSEALEFNGISNFLAPNLTNNAGENFVKENSKKNLNLNGKEGISISLWVNNDASTGDKNKEVLISKSRDLNSGYELYLKNDKIYFRVNGQSVSANLEKDSWHHIVARYDQGNGGGYNGILIDGEKRSSNLAGAGAIKDYEDEPLFIGGVYKKGNDGKKFDPSKFESAFGGMLDQVEIYNRYLVDFEVEKLCNIAAGEDWINEPTETVADICKNIDW